MAIGILTFGMLGANLIKVFEYLSKGIPFYAAMKFMMYVIPFALAFTIPMSLLVSIMLVFGRMSADNEITAIRACGISILQIISPIIIISFCLTCLCLYLQVEVGPRLRGKAKELVKGVIVEQPMALLDPGRSVEYEDIYIYIEDKVGGNKLKDIQIFRMSKNRKEIKQDISATEGEISVDKENQILKVILNNANIIDYSNGQAHPRRSFTAKLVFPLNYGKEFNKIKISKRTKYLSLKEIFGRSIRDRRLGLNTTKLEIELNQRIALALSPIAFLLLGMPLAIRTSRRETSIGLFLSVGLAGTYFILVMICTSLHSKPQLQPQLLLWIPNVVYQAVGIFFLFRIARK